MRLKYLELARNSIDLFAKLDGEQIIAESRQAVDCMDCEAVIASGIQAFRVLEETDICLRNAIYSGRLNLDAETFDLDECMLQLVTSWLKPVAHVDGWVSKCLSNGYTVERIEEFRQCVLQAQGIVDFLSGREPSVDLESAVRQAIEEHTSGKTTEFISEAE